MQQILQISDVWLRKTKNEKISFKGCMQMKCKISLQTKDLVYQKKKSSRQCHWEVRQLVKKTGFILKGRAMGI